MRVSPGQTVELVADWGESGATIGVRILDNEGATYAARVEGFSEYPAGSGIYYLDGFVVPLEEEQYTLLYDDDAGVAAPGHTATEELIVAGAEPVVIGDTYATREELARILKLRQYSEEQGLAMDRVLIAAAGEINSEIGVAVGESLSGWQYALAAEVNLERAVEHWRQQESPFGLAGLGAELGLTVVARDSWDRHAHKLAPLKVEWGIA